MLNQVTSAAARLWMGVLSALLLGSTLAACGAAEDSYDAGSGGNGGGQGFDESVELGQLEQPIYAMEGYGVDGNQNRCWSPSGWGGGVCYVPAGRGWHVSYPTLNNKRNCTDNQTVAAIQHAAQRWRDKLNALGTWDITISGDANAGSRPIIYVDCSQSTGGNLFGAVAVPNSCLEPRLECVGSKPWQVRRFDGLLGFTIFEKRIKQSTLFSPSFPQQDALRRRNFLVNVAQHEFYHVSGLGHDTCDQSDVMGGSACGVNAWLSEIKDISFFEHQALACFNPHPDNTNPSPSCF